MKKRIAVFSTTWNADVIGGIIEGVEEKARELGVELYIFNNYVGIEAEKDFNKCEYNIFNLPNLNRFDGLIIISNAVTTNEYMGAFYKRIIDSGIPCISVEQEVEGLHFLGTDNYAAMYELVEHLVTDHNCRTFNFIGGPENNVESKEREKAFTDVLAKYGISVDRNRIRYAKFTYSTAKEAFNSLREAGLEKADAVVCANDEMAISYIDSLNAEGYLVPQDVVVTGFDNSFNATSFAPSVTSVGRSIHSLGRQSVEQIMGMIEGKEYPRIAYAPHQFSKKCSCGCEEDADTRARSTKNLLYKMRKNNQHRWDINMLQKSLMTKKDEEDMRAGLYFAGEPLASKDYCVLLIPKEDNTDILTEKNYVDSFPEQMEVFYSNNKGNRSKYLFIETQDIVPPDFISEDELNIIVVTALHVQGNNLGYIAIKNGVNIIVEDNLFYCTSVVSVALQSMRQRVKINELNNKLSRMYIQDSLTTMYNRFALKNYGEPLYERNMLEGNDTLFLFGDLDGLKHINDTYGHGMGDVAIKQASLIIKSSVPDPTYFCIRYGGDEFLMIGTCNDERTALDIQEKIKNKMDEFNNTREFPFNLSVSTGYVLAKANSEGNSMDYYVKKADELMYQIKKSKRKKG